MQVCRYVKVCKYASMQVDKYAYMGQRDQDGKKVDEMSLFFLK